MLSRSPRNVQTSLIGWSSTLLDTTMGAVAVLASYNIDLGQLRVGAKALIVIRIAWSTAI